LPCKLTSRTWRMFKNMKACKKKSAIPALHSTFRAGILILLKSVSCLLASQNPMFSGDPNGRGTLVDEHGARYEGRFRNYERHGRGTLFFPDGGYRICWIFPVPYTRDQLNTVCRMATGFVERRIDAWSRRVCRRGW
jgi:hypothetical protein